MGWILTLDKAFGRLSSMCGWVASVAFILMLINVAYDVIARYVFNEVSIGMQEMEWHLYAVVFMLGIPYAMRTDGHVRVDFMYDNWSDRFKAWVNLTGALTLALPFSVLIAYYGYDYTLQSYAMGEGSGDPGGLPYRWIIKGLIPFTAFFMAVASLGMATEALRVLYLGDSYANRSSKGGIA